MVTIENASSILEIMFAVNAASVVIYNQYIKNKKDIISHVENEARKSGKDLDFVEKKYFQEAAYAIYTNFRPLNEYAFRILLIFSLTGTLLPLSLLTWSAINPDTADISATTLALLVIVFIIVLPCLYYLFFRLSSVLMNYVRRTSLLPAEVDMILIIAESKASIKEQERQWLEIEVEQRKHELQRSLHKARNFFTRSLNPLRTYNSWRLDRLLNQLEKEKHNDAN